MTTQKKRTLSKDLQALTFKEDVDNQNLADIQKTRPEVLEDNNKVEEKECQNISTKVLDDQAGTKVAGRGTEVQHLYEHIQL